MLRVSDHEIIECLRGPERAVPLELVARHVRHGPHGIGV